MILMIKEGGHNIIVVLDIFSKVTAIEVQKGYNQLSWTFKSVLEAYGLSLSEKSL